jgi:hypothetical protein
MEVNETTKAFINLSIQLSYNLNKHKAQKCFEKLVFVNDDGLFNCCKQKPKMKVV